MVIMYEDKKNTMQEVNWAAEKVEWKYRKN